MINIIFDSLEKFIADNEDEEDLDTISLVHASRLGLQKLSLYYQRTDDSPIFSCSTILDCASKFNYWREEEWEPVVINEQEKACRSEYKSFLYNSFTHQQNPQATIETLESTSSTSKTAAVMETSTTTPSSSTAVVSSSSTAVVTSSSTVAITSTSSATQSPIVPSSTKKSFGISGKRKLKIKNKEIEDSMKRQKPCNVSIKDLIEAGQRELIEYLASDDTEDFPIQELFFETCISDDDDDENEITTPNDIDINEEGYNGQQPVELSLETSSVVVIDSKYIKNQKLKQNQLWNGMAFARQSLDYWKHYQHKYPNLSRFARKILAIPATSVASERLFSLAKRTVNSNRANLSETNAEFIVLVSCWMKELKEVS